MPPSVDLLDSNKPTMLLATILLSVLFASRQVICTSYCPRNCHCLTVPTHPDQMKITCRWQSITDSQLAFENFRRSRTRSLTLHCTDRTLLSQMNAGLFQGFDTLRHLQLFGCAPSGGILRANLFKELAQLRTLQLDSFSYPGAELAVEADSFAGLYKLEKLMLTGSNVVSLPEASLCGLQELKILNLSLNSFNSIKRVGLRPKDCVNQLVLFDISHNRISKIEKADLDPLKTIHVLIATSNMIQSVEEDAFVMTTKLQKLYLTENRISELQDLPARLSELQIGTNQLSIIPSAISGLQTLTLLNASDNRLDDTTPFFLQSSHLRKLYLDYNDFASIPAQFFANTTQLHEISMVGNRIASIETNVFQPLTQLKTLDLDYNRLDIIGEKEFEGLKELTTLRIANNLIKQLHTNAFSTLLKLQKISLSGNLLLDIPVALTRLYAIERMNLSANKINNVPKFLFNKLPNLRSLDLASNLLTVIERYVFEDMRQVVFLSFAGNQISSVAAKAFHKNQQLLELHLEDNRIGELRDVVNDLKGLTSLNISNNSLTHLHYSMLPVSLLSLSASNNRIAQLSNTIDDRTLSLQNIDLSFNRIEYLDASVVPATARMANFSFNNISTISPHTFQEKVNMEWVDLRYNKLSELNESSMAVDFTGQKVYTAFLSHNPLLCSCKMNWIKRQTDGTSGATPFILDFDDLLCKQPHKGAVRRLRELDYGDLLCRYDMFCTDGCPCCEFSSCDCKNVCPDGCNCFHDASYATNLVDCSNLQHPITIHSIPMFASVIYLDGGNIGEVKKHDFLGRYQLRELYLNGSKVHTVQKRAFNGLSSLEVLDLSDNELSQFRGDELENTDKLRHLFLNGNTLSSLKIQALAGLPNLHSLTLHRNSFSDLPPAIVEAAPTLSGLTLAHNPWRCDCGDRFALQRWLPTHQSLVSDASDVYCFENLTASAISNDSTVLSQLPGRNLDGDEIVKVNFWTFRSEINKSFCYPTDSPQSADKPALLPEIYNLHQQNIIYIAVAVVTAVVGVAFLLLFVWKIRSAWRTRRQYKAPPSLNSTNSTNTTPVPLICYDAFVSYSKADERFVLDQLVAGLECTNAEYTLCLLHRDLATHTESHQVDNDMIACMGRAKCLLLVLTDSFLKEWELVQMRTAHQCVLSDKLRPKKLITVVAGHRDILNRLDDTLGRYVRHSKLIHYASDPLFWEELSDALPLRPPYIDSLNTSTYYSDMYYGTIVDSPIV